MALPDFPTLKDDISAVLFGINKAAMNTRMGPVAKARRITYHEGDKADFATVQGEIKEMPDDLYEVGATLVLSDLGAMSHQQIVEAVAKIGIEFGDQMVRTAMSVISEGAESVGNVTAGSLNAKSLLSVYESLQMDFDDDGVPHPIDFMGDPRVEARARELLDDEEFKAGYEALLDRKREEWRARESNRKLVD